MPRISMFYGIVVYMYYDDHEPPHFHVLYEGQEVVYNIDGTVRHGRPAPRAHRLISEWTELHRTELEENWARAQNSLPLNWIEPLH